MQRGLLHLHELARSTGSRKQEASSALSHLVGALGLGLGPS